MSKKNDSKLSYTTGVSDFKRNLTYYLSLAEKGATIKITRYGRPIAQLVANNHFENSVCNK